MYVHMYVYVTRPPSGHEFRKRSLARGKGSKKRFLVQRIYDMSVARKERERKGGFLCISPRIAEINVERRDLYSY